MKCRRLSIRQPKRRVNYRERRSKLLGIRVKLKKSKNKLMIFIRFKERLKTRKTKQIKNREWQ
jgi:hypothetical protein